MAAQLNLVAILTPKEGKADRVIELLQGVAEYVKSSEPTTTRYEITRSFQKEAKIEEIIMIESYKDKAALDLHGSSDAFKVFAKTMQDEELLGAPMQLKVAQPAGGFASRL
ncbi:hypothetical protein BJ875DRAFT_168870 [Amylocarpus encephaloides]|uniref:ABM domain-containing protein n=1 Tax=Amylocarpus encephaloides TaxID=45428 RepID=A0A9P8C9M6_9HELO|nr:hypothetical protein BJ875DRAFT_168870 [Amylocarpus encephaloides]